MSKELEKFIRSLHWRSKEEMEDYIELLKERLKEIKEKNK